jgi:hypothetical protein
MWSHLGHISAQIFGKVLAWFSATPFSFAVDLFVLFVVFGFSWRREFGKDWHNYAVIRTSSSKKWSAGLLGVLVTVGIIVLALCVAVPVTVYQDHIELTERNSRLTIQNGNLIAAQDTLSKEVGRLTTQVSHRAISPSISISGSRNTPPVVIANAVLEIRSVCTLRDMTKLPDDAPLIIPEPQTYLYGQIGKAYVGTSANATYKRSENGDVLITMVWPFPSHSDLVGQELSTLKRYSQIVISGAAINGDQFNICKFIEVTLRINGSDTFRDSQKINYALPEGKELGVTLPLSPLNLPK